MPTPKTPTRTRKGVRYRRVLVMAGDRYAVWRPLNGGEWHGWVAGTPVEPHLWEERDNLPATIRRAAGYEAHHRRVGSLSTAPASGQAIRAVLWDTQLTARAQGYPVTVTRAIDAALIALRPEPKPDTQR